MKRAIALDTNETVAVKGLSSFLFSSKKKACSFTRFFSFVEIQKHKFLSNPKTLQLFEREIGILEKLEHVCFLVFFDHFSN